MILGAVLAGGQARRFGADKALAEWQGRTLLAHAIEALARHCDRVIVCGRGEAPVDCVPDRPVSDLGPLGGLNGALHHAAGHGFLRVVACGCDTPVLPDDLLATLAASEAPRYVAELPVIGVWPAMLAPALDKWLAEGADRSMRGWARIAGAMPVSAPGLANVNFPADLAALGGGSASSDTPSPEETMNG